VSDVPGECVAGLLEARSREIIIADQPGPETWGTDRGVFLAGMYFRPVMAGQKL
jgi:hypothetical protein